MLDVRQFGHAAPELNYVNHGPIICDKVTATAPGERMDQSYSTYYAMGPMLPKGFTFANHGGGTHTESSHVDRDNAKQEYAERDVLGRFDPSRIPPRVAFKLIPARGAIESEITDFPNA